ncbi:MAG: D-TA family PLP-dependent enzyme [Candidatus Poribacteria bacterium]|nr:D-TA family PLP-dependent enzyme [Candidatus Poribacteria bacterium]MDE0465616.1 D-TA family PLP-dependent enzyme [Candidatus Poribacteria bacterium]
MDKKYRIQNVETIPSPSLVVYLAQVQYNIEHAIATVDGDVSKLRPHAKTHKTAEIIAMERDAGILKHKCATLREAEMLAQNGIADILIAYQMVGPNVNRFVSLQERYLDADFKVVVDHQEAVTALSSAAAKSGLTVKVMLDLDVGMNRTGIPVGDAAVDVYAQIEAADGLQPWGLHVYDGHIHDEDLAERKTSCSKSLAQVEEMQDRLAAKGLEVPLIVMGGTPTFPIYAETPGVETSPGTFIFHDHGYTTRYPDLGFTPAALLLSRIISIPTLHRITLDLGHKAIAADPDGVRGVVLSIDDAEVSMQHEEHWAINVPDSTPMHIGQEIYVCPTHICPCVALHPFYYLVDTDGYCRGTWEVTARNRSAA